MRLWLFCLLFSSSAFAVAPFTVQKLPNGLDVVLMESHKIPLVTVVLAAKAGSMTESLDSNGLTHLWEHMFFKGNKALPNQEAYNKRVRQLGIVFNGDTSAEKVRYFFTMPSAFLADGVQFMYDAIATPLLEQKELEKERRVVLDEYDRNAAQPGFDIYRLTNRLIYGDLFYLRSPLGERPIIESATREQLLKIKDDVFVPQNSALFISGDFDSKETIALVQKIFSSWSSKPNWSLPKHKPFIEFPKTTEYVMTRDNVENPDVRIVFKGPNVVDNKEDTFTADIFVSLLNNRSGRFYKKLIDSGLAFSAGLGFPTQAEAGELMIYASSDPKNIVKVKETLLEEVNAWKDPKYFKEEQLADVKRSLGIDFKRELNSPSEYVKNLAYWWAISGLDYHRDYLKNMNKVKLSDVTNFANRYFVGHSYVSSILISPSDAKEMSLKDTSAELIKKYVGM